MPNIAELGLNLGDKVKFITTPHLDRFPETIEEVLEIRKVTEESFELEIVGLEDNVVYLHPWTEKLAAFSRVQNIETGEIDAVRELKPNERYVLAMNRDWPGFSPAT